MLKFSANLGFLWTDLSLVDAVHAASDAGFDAVECHWPYDTPSDELNRALSDTGLQMLGLNTLRGDTAAGENGLCAVPGRGADAVAVIDQAIDYARQTSIPNIHIMAGNAAGDAAHETFIENLKYAAERAAEHGMTILIEPLNHYDAPDYFLKTSTQAVTIIDQVGAPNLKLMFDCYHIQIMEGDVSRRLQKLLPLIGHIQFASVPDRREPDGGELSYDHIFSVLNKLGYDRPLGAEYKPEHGTDDGLNWLRNYQTGSPLAAG